MNPQLVEGLNAIDLFAGPGGWDVAARELGIDPLGIEIDNAACATREAAGLRTVQASVAELDPHEFPCELLIASPPCPTFSTAGKGAGIEDMALVYEAAECAARGKPIPELPWKDERSALVVEPLRWAIALEPRFLAWEQVPPVLPFWEHCAEILRRKGWNVWTGKVEAERYGVPQTRERAILMADREAPVHPPRPTHQRYVKGEPQRNEVTLEGEVLPWVSMAEALGWSESASIETGNFTAIARDSDGGRSKAGSVPYERTASAPAPVLTGNADSWRLRNGNQDNATERDAEEPASTIAFGHNAARVEWVYDRRQQNADGSPVPPRPATDPAPTLSANGLAKSTHQWVAQRPATAVCGDPRISPPGYRGRRDDYDADGNLAPGKRSGDNAIRVTLEEALILQSFPPDYPVQGNKSQRFLQVGNAVPPLLAHAILSALLAQTLNPERGSRMKTDQKESVQ